VILIKVKPFTLVSRHSFAACGPKDGGAPAEAAAALFFVVPPSAARRYVDIRAPRAY
jgi:hypothetical protein